MDYSQKPERKNPRKGVNIISQLLFLWVIPIFWKGLRRGLTKKDHTKCLKRDESKMLGDELELRWNNEIERAKRQKRKPRLRYALFRMFVPKFILDGFSILTFVLIRTCVPMVLAQLLIQLKDGAKNQETNQFILPIWDNLFWLAGLICLMMLVSIVISHHSDLRLQMTGARMRIACCSLIYRKTLRLSAQAACSTGIGSLMNLMTNDVSHLDDGFLYIHYVWMLPVQSILVCYFLWQRIQWAALVGVLALLLQSIPVQTILVFYIAALRIKLARCIDTRVDIMNELIENIRMIKMYAWEIPFEKIVANARRLEMKQIRYLAYINGISQTSIACIDYTTIFISITTCLLTGQNLTADLIFPMNLHFDALKLIARGYYPDALTFGAEAMTSIKRIEKFLLKDEKDDFSFRLERRISFTDSDPNTNIEDAILISDVSASWENDSNRKTLQHIQLKIQPGKLYAIVGSVGCGKSSLMQLMLGELPIQDGQIVMHGSISYAGEKPWLFSGTIRNNILFGQTFDRNYYDKVVECCALTFDLEQLPFGDQTQIDEHGTTLSHSQRARISLARAIYKRASIYIFDNPISTVEPYIITRVVDDTIGPAGLIENATRILVTHQTHILKEADVVVIVKNGTIVNTGSYTELLRSDLDLAELLRMETTNDESSNDDYFDVKTIDNNAAKRQSTISKMSRFSRASQPFIVESIEMSEPREYSTFQAFRSYILSGTNQCGFVWMFSVMLLLLAASGWVDYFLTFWTNLENNRLNGDQVPLTQYEYLGIYGALQICLIFISIYQAILFIKTSLRSSTILHNQMLHGVLYAPMHFFRLSSAASILDSFSDDLNALDENVPQFVQKGILVVMSMLNALLIIVIVDPQMLGAILCAAILLYFIIKFHAKASQDLERFSGSSYSSVLSHLTATINGLTTIRTRNIQTRLIDEFHGLQNQHSAVWQLVQSAKAARDLWVDLISFLFVVVVIFNYLILHRNEFNGNLGLTVVQALALIGKVKNGIRKETEIIGGLNCVKRILEFTHIEPEQSPDKEPPEDWPRSGKIKLHNILLRYDLQGPPRLKNVRLEIESGSKVGVVGRTGAGKNSLIDALFRLAHVEGIIEIDDIDTESISLSSLRRKIAIIPQDPVLFSNTVRYNLDPLGKYTDDEIWQVLEVVELKSTIESLDYHVTEEGTNFSQGQRQLIYLARAILKNSKVLVIEETTADRSPTIDVIGRELIRQHFTNATVIVVANNLFTVIETDRVLVMEAGRAREYDIPHILLLNENSIFRRMVEATGPQESQLLKKLAAKKFNETFRKRSSSSSSK